MSSWCPAAAPCTSTIRSPARPACSSWPTSTSRQPPSPPRRMRKSAAVQAKAKEALALMDAAERPVLLLGNGIRLAGGQAAMRDVIDRLGAPVLLTWHSIDMLPDTHPLFAGRPGLVAPRGANFTLQN